MDKMVGIVGELPNKGKGHYPNCVSTEIKAEFGRSCWFMNKCKTGLDSEKVKHFK